MRALPVAICCAAALPAPAAAQTTQSFTVGATIVPGCRVETMAGGDWGRINLGSVPGTASGTVEADLIAAGTGIAIECTPGTTASVRADAGQNASGGVRALARTAGGATRLPYRLILEGGSEWTTQAIALDFTSATPVRRLPIRGRAVLPGALAAGRYVDTVNITISW
ncbi:Csu type fimbrial protein [Sphingomonas baiyangensis]|uniref:Csu type fimbrial protein n=1 Tax=Sphingomonas baiyangensis TaxID=2572576 RepID=UPI00146DE0D4|nr:spore coat protein U domain-containing protein [Sphingomonas baiyangensis]